MPEFSAQEIEELLINNPYDGKILSQIESYVQQQSKDPAQYDFDANRHLLKLYSNEPDAIKMDMVQRVLIMALMHLPNPDFLACTYLLKEELHDDDHLRGVFKLSSLLETAQFTKFWKEMSDSKMKSVVGKVAGFEDAIRTFMCTVMESTYQSVAISTLKDLLHVKDIAAIAKTRGWTKDSDGKYMVFALSEGNQIPKMTTTENIGLTDICKFLSMAKVM